MLIKKDHKINLNNLRNNGLQPKQIKHTHPSQLHITKYVHSLNTCKKYDDVKIKTNKCLCSNKLFYVKILLGLLFSLDVIHSEYQKSKSIKSSLTKYISINQCLGLRSS